MKKQLVLRIILAAGVLALVVLALVFWPPSGQSAAGGNGAESFQTVQVRKGNAAAVINTSGVVRSKQSALLIWQTSGTVDKVDVSLGQALQEGTVLASLEMNSLPQAVILSQAELVNAQKSLDTLLNSNQGRANAQMALVKAQQALEDAEKDRRSKLYQRASPETIDIARARVITANDALSQAENFYNTHNGNPESLIYAAALDQLAKARQLQNQALYNLYYVEGLPSPLDIEEADALIAVAKANLLQAKTDWERVKDGPNDQDVAAAEARVAAAQATVNLVRITAPFSGTVTLAKSQAGDRVAAGTTAFQIDDLSRLYIDTAVTEEDVARIKTGQAAAIVLDALPGQETTGVVTEVGAVGVDIAGAVNFTITIEISNPGAEIKPGMSASVEIDAGQAPETLLVPAAAVYTLEGQKVVYLLKDGAPAPVAVVTGPTAGIYTTVLRGAIQAGDRVILNPKASE